jgi:hypothetical protein
MDTAGEITAQVTSSLQDGPYAAASLEMLSGGTANFVYRVVLSRPLEDGSKTVVVKHTEGFAAFNREFKLQENRCVSSILKCLTPSAQTSAFTHCRPQAFEQSILSALRALPPSTHNAITIQSPKLYQFFANTNSQIQSDLPSSTTLKTYFLNYALTQEQCSRLGQSLGLWLKKFHAWGAEPEQEKVREEMRGNTAMRDLKWWLNYGPNITAAIEKYPDILDPSKDIFESVGCEVREMLDRGEGNLTHGDFWSGNYASPLSLRWKREADELPVCCYPMQSCLCRHSH